MSESDGKRVPLIVDSQGFAFAGGVKFGRFVQRDGVTVFQVCDKNRYRSYQRGTDKVEVAFNDLAKVVQNGGESS